MVPSDRRYTKDHEWVAVSNDTATVGITDFAQRELGDIVYVELPAPGKQVRTGDVLGTIESVKAVSEIFAPLAGTVIESNHGLDEHPETVNRDAHGAGWYCKLRLSKPEEVGSLLDAAAYERLIGV
jgi:glycine cleavage system H protein